VGFFQGPVSALVQEKVGFDEWTVWFDASPVLIAAVLVVLADVWNRGVQLRTDQELTI
jgi:hypothetical protein